MGNSQSSSEKDEGGGANNVESQADARLRRFHTGASDVASIKGLSPAPSLRRTSTTATSSASEKEHALLGRAAESGEGSRASAHGRRSGTVSATGSPRASEREKAWVRSVGRKSSGMSAKEGSSTSQRSQRSRSRSDSIGNLLSGGEGNRSRGATLHEDEVFDPHQEQKRAGKRAEVTFRRKKSIELSDVVEPGAFTKREEPRLSPSTPFGRVERRSSLASPPSTADDSQQTTVTSSPLLQPEGGADADLASGGQNQGEGSLTADVYNPLFPPHRGSVSDSTRDSLGRSQPAAFPSYLKIPTLIPSTYASPTSSLSSSPSASEMKGWPAEELPSATVQPTAFPTKLGAAASAAAAILNTEDVVIKPGGASKASSPTGEKTQSEPRERPPAEAVEIQGSAGQRESDEGEGGEGANGNPSRTPTPTPGNLRGARAMTPTGQAPATMSTLSPATSTSSTVQTEGQADATTGPEAQQTGLPARLRRAGVEVYTGNESGPNTPGLPGLPVGMTSAPSSALTPSLIPTFDGNNAAEPPKGKATNPAKVAISPSAKVRASAEASEARGSSVTPTRATATAPPVPVMPIVVKWRGGGKEVFVTGTFANEWRSKILLKRTGGSGKKAEYSCVLQLTPGTHRLKFIVDDRWRVSRDLSTASDGEGNLTNYIEVAHLGPAHPGPLSAPGEDFLLGEEEEERKRREGREGGIGGHKATIDLIEEARRAEALRRGDLLDVFGEDKVRKEERWTQEIPEAIVRAQAAEEAHRTEAEQHPQSGRRDSMQSEVPAPPTLPRQLEKVILNSSPSAVAGAVDDTSVLPAPNHAVLHHLTASAIKSGVIATGCTTRYRKKYITTIYYRAAK